MEGAVMRKTTLFLFHMYRFRVWTPGKVNSLYSLRYLLIDYYIHYNKSDFDALEIHDVALKVQIICPRGETAYQRTASACIYTLDIPKHSWEDIICTIRTAAILQAQYSIDSGISLKYNNDSLDGESNGRRSCAKNDSFLVPSVEVPVSNPGQGKQLVFFKVSSNLLLYTL